MQILRRAAHWKIPLALTLACGIVALVGDDARLALRYERDGIANGEYWRLLGAHIGHLGRQHLLLNLAGLTVVWLLVGRHCRQREWLVIGLVSVAAIDAGLWFLDPGLRWYVGLSGLLHGLLLGGAIRGLKSLPVEAGIVIALVCVKLIYEQVLGPLPGSESMAGGAVVVNAHLYGAAGGAAAALLLPRSVRASASI